MALVKKNKWHIAYKKRNGNIFDFSDLETIESPPDTYFADPFLFSHEGKDYVFFEYYDYEKGKIAMMDLESKEIETVLEKNHHLSFPAVVEIYGQIYMTPEQGNSGKLEIYRSSRFPDKWEVVAKVADGSFADPILTYKNGYYVVNASDSNNRAVTYRSTKIDGKWDLIRSEDDEYNRPAGQPFIWQGRELKPYQDCLKTYGGAVVLKEGEKVVKRIEPTIFPKANGLHTFNVSDKYVILDYRIPLQ